eukprot:13425701-Heterocapsa_arctica.AAC.1
MVYIAFPGMLHLPEAQSANTAGNTVSPLKGASVISAIASPCQVLRVATSGPRTGLVPLVDGKERARLRPALLRRIGIGISLTDVCPPGRTTVSRPVST